jgi:hypothetical protein
MQHHVRHLDAGFDHIAAALSCRPRSLRPTSHSQIPRGVHRQPRADVRRRVTHRDHAIVEQVIAELKNSPLAHLPSGRFAANAAWLVCVAIAHNLTRSAGVLAGGTHDRARAAPLRARLIPARVAHSAHRQPLHLPRDWP